MTQGWLSALALAAFALAGSAWAQAPQGNKAPARAEHARRPVPPPVAWAELSPAEKAALQPLESKWHTIDGPQQRKWRIIAHRYAKASPVEQQRMHERMQAWVILTPEQRRLARENYQAMRRVDPSTRVQRWSSYEQLPPEKRIQMHALVEQQRKNAHPAGKRPLQLPPPVVAVPPAPATADPALAAGARPRILPAPGLIDRNTLLPTALPEPAAGAVPPASQRN
ncbi:MAG: DUF3106 domain-containing protein [Betaproteobacteria bacterium]|nr:DUF3106 domain-containing protein [Betaproteobacteria bacterium]